MKKRTENAAGNGFDGKRKDAAGNGFDGKRKDAAGNGFDGKRKDAAENGSEVRRENAAESGAEYEKGKNGFKTLSKEVRTVLGEWKRKRKRAVREKDGKSVILYEKIITTVGEARHFFCFASEKTAKLALSLSEQIWDESDAEPIGQRCLRVLERNREGEGYDLILLRNLKSALVLTAFLKAGANPSREGAPGLWETLLRVLRLDEEKMIRSFSAAYLLIRRENADTVRLCDKRTVNRYLTVIERQSEKAGLSEEETARRLVAAANRKNVHIGELLLRLDRNETAGQVYFVSLFSFSLLFLLLLAFLLPLSALKKTVCLLAASLPVYETVKLFLRRFFAGEDNGFLPSLDPKTAATHRVLVAIPSLLLGEAHDSAVFDRLEDHYLTNREENFYFAVLGDLSSSVKKHEKKDEVVLAYASRRIAALNQKYGNRFFLLTRPRRYSRAERLYMGWERKRGAVIDLCRFLCEKESGITVSVGDEKRLKDIPYLFTLDEDTSLHAGAVGELLAIAVHPCNRVRFDEKGRLAHGHGIIAPCVNTSLSSGEKTFFSHLTTMPGGIDPYTGTSFDLYRDVFGSGSFCGKGMIDVFAFCRIIPDFFPSGAVLSHDLMEGNLLRSALAACLPLTDSAPETPVSYYAREERWIRGDVQALRFAGKTVRTRTGKKRNPMTPLGRYKIVDNVLREASPFFSVALLFSAGTLSGLPAILLAVTALLPILFPLLDLTVFSLVGWVKKELSFSSFLRTKKQGLLRFLYDFLSLGYRSVLFLCAFCRAFYRMVFSHRHLLAWQTASQVSGEKKSGAKTFCAMMPGAVLGGAALLLLSFPPLRFLLGTWVFFPVLAVLWERPRKEAVLYSEKEKERLRGYAEDMWRYFSDRVTAENHYLPPDNEQFQPVHRVAARTSPTNIGLYLLSLLAARDFKWIDSETLHRKAERTGQTLAGLQKWKGHLFNWYDTRTTQVIGEPFISSVDSGNFVTSLVAFCEGLREYAAECPLLLDDIRLYEAMIGQTDFSALYSERRDCLSIGYHLRDERQDESCYDTYMSEFRTTAFYLTATGTLSPASFFSLSRLMAGQRGKEGFLSWSGTAFEYFMPSLLLPTMRQSAVRQSQKHAAALQAAQSKTAKKGLSSVYGISESGYFAFDADMNYQYHAFGIGPLALDPDQKTGRVFAPYAAFLMLWIDKRAYEALRGFEKYAMKGRYGFYEAIDFDESRVGGGYAVIKSVMAHHLGMSLVSCANICFDGIFQKRFMRHPLMRASAELLCEKENLRYGRAPKRLLTENAPVKSRATVYSKEKEETESVFRDGRGEKPRSASDTRSEYVEKEVITESNALFPSFTMLSNGKCRLIGSSLGHIAWMSGKDCLCHSEFDPESLGGGLRVLFAVDGDVYAATPLGGLQKNGRFSMGREGSRLTYRAEYRRDGRALLTSVSFFLYPDGERMKVSAKLTGPFKKAKAFLWCEPILEPLPSYEAHKCFSYLSLESRFDADEKVLVCKRRPKTGEKPYRFFGISMPKEDRDGFAFDTIRENSLFSGYGDGDIAALALKNEENENVRTGAVLYPGFRLSARFRQSKNASVSFLFGASDEEDELFYMLCHAKERPEAEKALSRLHSFLAQGKSEVPLLERYVLGAFLTESRPKPSFAPSELYALRETPYRQNDFWKVGLSGEEPLLTACLCSDEKKSMENLRLLLLLFRFATVRGLRYEFLILYREKAGLSLSEKVREAVNSAGLSSFLDARDGIVLLDDNLLPERDRKMLFSYSSFVFDCRVDPVITAKARRRFLDIGETPVFSPPIRTVFPCDPFRPSHPVEATQAGVFHENGFCFEKKNKRTVWAHILAGEGLGTVLSENSLGFTFFSNAAKRKLTPHTSDGMTEDTGERLFLRLPGEGGDGGDLYDLIACSGAVDYRGDAAVFKGRIPNAVSYTVTVTVGERIPSKKIAVELKNEARVPLSYALSYAVIPDLGIPPCFCDTETEENRLRVFPLCDFGAGRLSFSLFSDGKDPVFYTDYVKFRTAGALTLDKANRAVCTLGGKLEKTALHSFYLSANGDFRPEDERKREKSRDEVRLSSDDPLFDLTVNFLFPYQTENARLKARSGFYQVGGAYGFRDQLQDTLSLLDSDPDRAKVQILRACAHQFEEGDVLHWWHTVRDTGKEDFGVRTHISDDLLWLPFAACLYTSVTGDKSLWETSIRYLTAPPLFPGERDRCEHYEKSRTRGSVFEHCAAALDHSLGRIGSHGLPLFGAGDWNDGMNEVGAGGKGESVWLGQFLYLTLSLFSPICDARGDLERALRYEREKERIRAALAGQFEKNRFLRGYYDDGSALGSEKSVSCKMDVLPQAFSAFCAVLSGDGAELGRAKIAMKTALSLLWHEKQKVFCLLAPPFDSDEENPGYIRGYVPGVRENGAQYTHAAVWASMALLTLGQNKTGYRLLCDLNPALRARSGRLAGRYRVEPYVMAGDVTAAFPFTGRGGWSWYTGAAGWYRTAVLNYLCGYRPSGSYFTLCPRLSSLFDGFSLTVCRGKSRFLIRVFAGETYDCILDGKRLPSADPENVRFYFDGKEHSVSIACRMEDGD